MIVLLRSQRQVQVQVKKGRKEGRKKISTHRSIEKCRKQFSPDFKVVSASQRKQKYFRRARRLAIDSSRPLTRSVRIDPFKVVLLFIEFIRANGILTVMRGA